MLLVVQRGHAMQRATGEPDATPKTRAFLLSATGSCALGRTTNARLTAFLIRNAALTIVVPSAHATCAAVSVLATVHAGVRDRAILPCGALIVGLDATACRPTAVARSGASNAARSGASNAARSSASSAAARSTASSAARSTASSATRFCTGSAARFLTRSATRFCTGVAPRSGTGNASAFARLAAVGLRAGRRSAIGHAGPGFTVRDWPIRTGTGRAEPERCQEETREPPYDATA